MPTIDAPWHVARITGDPEVVGATMVRKIRELDPTNTVVDVQTMTDRMSASMARQRFSTLMLGSFAAFALLLAIVGIYGVMSHLVTQGAHDIGVRMALGAEGRSILLMVLRQGLVLTIGGVVIGLLGAYGVTRVMANLLFGVSTTDLMTFATVPIILTATAIARDLHSGPPRNPGGSSGSATRGIDFAERSLVVPSPVDPFTARRNKDRLRLTLHLGLHSFHSQSNRNARSCVGDSHYRVRYRVVVRGRQVLCHSVGKAVENPERHELANIRVHSCNQRRDYCFDIVPGRLLRHKTDDTATVTARVYRTAHGTSARLCG